LTTYPLISSYTHNGDDTLQGEIIISSVKSGFLSPLKKEVYLCNMKL